MSDFVLLGGSRQLFTKLKGHLAEMGALQYEAYRKGPDKLFPAKRYGAIFIDADELSATGQWEKEVLSLKPFFPIIILLTKKSLHHIPRELWQDDSIDVLSKPVIKEMVVKRIKLMMQQVALTKHDKESTQKLSNLKNQLRQADQIIQTDKDEKDVLLQEIHHRVKNNLQIISSILDFNTGKVKDPQLKEILQSTQSRVDTISLLHRTLYQSTNLAEINMQEFVPQQINDIFMRFPEKAENLCLELKVDQVVLEVNRALHCALLINELVVNAVMHAFQPGEKGVLKIRLLVDTPKQTHLEITDNGRGLPARLDLQNPASIGFRLVNQLVKQLKAKLSVEVKKGTRFHINGIQNRSE